MIESELDVDLALNSQVRWEQFIDLLRDPDTSGIERREDAIAMLESLKRRLEEKEQKS